MPHLVLLGMAVLLLRVGLAVYVIGVTRAKNSAGAAMRAVCDLCVAVLAFWAVGAALFSQTANGVLGMRTSLLFARTPTDAGAVFFLACVAAVASGIVPGAVGERSRFLPLLTAPLLVAGVVMPVCGNWAWQGWLRQLGFVDVAGGSWVHVAGGVCAAAAAWTVGPREGKFHRDGSASVIPGHAAPLAALGGLLLFACWPAYVAGCWGAGPFGATEPAARAGLVALEVLLAGAAGCVASLIYGQVRYGKPDVLLTLIGILGALAAISAGAGVVAAPWAVVIGAIAGVLAPVAALWIDLVARIDDPASAVAVHAVGGGWGVLAAGLFAPGGVATRLKHLGVQAVGLVAIVLVAAALSLALFAVLRATVGVRAKEADEFDGLDLAEHDIGAYPDFQQNTIRSYHLREA
jgi:Amt family ammonium transporter